jgi:hypothetical protein
MISCVLNGGLGNQLFQIATTYAMALDCHDKCGFDFSMKPVHQGNSPQSYRHNIYRKLMCLPKGWKPSTKYREKDSGYQKLPYHRDIQYVGYLGHEKYFSHRKTEVLNLFKDDITINNIKRMFPTLFDNSVSLHVRRGDYLSFPDVYIMPTIDYYDKAISYVDSKRKIDHIIVISDDIPWCMDNLKDPRMVFMDGTKDYVDLYIMTLCEHNILANSSFSWWGAYMNTHQNKIVVSPVKWFKKESGAKDEYLICNDWIKI